MISSDGSGWLLSSTSSSDSSDSTSAYASESLSDFSSPDDSATSGVFVMGVSRLDGRDKGPQWAWNSRLLSDGGGKLVPNFPDVSAVSPESPEAVVKTIDAISEISDSSSELSKMAATSSSVR